MGLILGIIVAIGTVLLTILILFANSMSDAPSAQGISAWPTLIIGGITAALLIGSHYAHLSW